MHCEGARVVVGLGGRMMPCSCVIEEECVCSECGKRYEAMRIPSLLSCDCGAPFVRKE